MHRRYHNFCTRWQMSMLWNRCLVLLMYLQIQLMKPSNRLLIARSTRDRDGREGGSRLRGYKRRGLSNKAEKGLETCDGCRNPNGGNRSMFLRSLAAILAFKLNRYWRNVNRGPDPPSVSSCFINIVPSQLHVTHYSFKLAPDRGLDSHLPRF
jgi:hypothetical protein